jgi:hypothetical protein
MIGPEMIALDGAHALQRLPRNAQAPSIRLDTPARRLNQVVLPLSLDPSIERPLAAIPTQTRNPAADAARKSLAL